MTVVRKRDKPGRSSWAFVFFFSEYICSMKNICLTFLFLIAIAFSTNVACAGSSISVDQEIEASTTLEQGNEVVFTVDALTSKHTTYERHGIMPKPIRRLLLCGYSDLFRANFWNIIYRPSWQRHSTYG